MSTPTREFQGSIPALITPMHGDGRLDVEAFADLVRWHGEMGSHGLVPTGTTGESPTLSHEEHKQIIDVCVQEAGGLPVIAGTGSNNTEEALALSLHAQRAGADAVLVVTPYYNKPTQEGLYWHYRRLSESLNIPVIIYNIPGRSVVDMTVETMQRLHADCRNIKGVKDATCDLARPLDVRTVCGPDFCQLSGEDATVAAFLGQGGHGCISVSANVAPKLCADLHNAWMAKNWATFEACRDRLMPLHKVLFCESSPGPVKYALSLLGRCEATTRLPLVEVSEANKARIRAVVESLNLT